MNIKDLNQNPNAKDRDGRTPIFDAVVQGNIDLLRSLIRAGADVDVQDLQSNTPLHFAATYYR
ncbi:MAG: ankyrin repeat domain-containing protein, partial [bacterium]